MGLGAFPAPHEQWLGMLGMHGTRTANYAMDEADLIVAIGARFDDRITGKLSEFAPRAKFIHIDIDPAEISKNVPAHIPIVGDAKNILPRLTAEYRALEADPARLEEWWERIQDWQQAATRCGYEDSKDAEIKPQYMVAGALRGDRRRRHRHLRRRPAPDVDGAVLPLRRAAPVDQLRRPGDDGLRPAGGDGREGRLPGRPRVCVAGDGSVQMNMQELATCAEYDIPIKVFIMNNGYLGHGPPVAGAVLGQALQRRSTWASARTSSSSPRPTARRACA